jgi:hypothetical protein
VSRNCSDGSTIGQERESPGWVRTAGGGRSTANSVQIDQLLITLTDVKAEVISYLEAPMEQLPVDE